MDKLHRDGQRWVPIVDAGIPPVSVGQAVLVKSLLSLFLKCMLIWVPVSDDESHSDVDLSHIGALTSWLCVMQHCVVFEPPRSLN